MTCAYVCVCVHFCDPQSQMIPDDLEFSNVDDPCFKSTEQGDDVRTHTVYAANNTRRNFGRSYTRLHVFCSVPSYSSEVLFLKLHVIGSRMHVYIDGY